LNAKEKYAIMSNIRNPFLGTVIVPKITTLPTISAFVN
jgi:hypothetical protein